MEKNHSKRNLIISLVIYTIIFVFVSYLGDLGFSKSERYIVILAIGAVLLTIQYYYMRKNRAKHKDKDGEDRKLS